MIKVNKDYDTLNEECVLNKYIQKRHKLLLFLRNEEDLGKNATVLEISDKFHITKDNAWKKLRRLEKIGDVKKGEKIAANGNEYHNFIITNKVRQELSIVSRNLYENHYQNIPTDKVDRIREDFIEPLKDRMEQVMRTFLPEGKRCAALIQTLTKEIHDFYAEKFDSK